MKRRKKLKVPPSAMVVILLLAGFGTGYTTKDYGRTRPQPLPPSAQVAEGAISVCFTPNKQCQAQILQEIDQAKTSIFVQAYSFTDKHIARALASAAGRGVAVKVLLDKSNRNDNRSAKSILIQSGLPLRFDAPSGIAHNKIMIIDAAKVISGSYNFSAAAYTRNTENLLIINSSTLAKDYIQNWQTRWDLSQ